MKAITGRRLRFGPFALALPPALSGCAGGKVAADSLLVGNSALASAPVG